MAWDLTLEFQLSAPPARVMQLLTDAALIRKWSGEDAVIENKPGGRMSMYGGWVTGEVTKTSADELAYTWLTTDQPMGAKPSEVHFVLKKQDGGTRVILKHTGFATEEEMKEHRSGWADTFFEPLEDFIMIFDNRE
ncbi:hypothetical protein GCM10023093_16130 [Nemorincola caseinilytica]|uniref:Activator of Hsp90 ATPase homologue 1/2-like C-terminal domain-containing protein n=1 Tax=Nemorincola caseinilytica TaxID=2054315 RepID=A0ABP8NF63_9BACT